MATAKPTFLAQPTVKCVRVYRNGDPFYAGRKFVINERQISTFEAFLKEVTSGLEAPFGAVRNIYTPQQGHRVYQLEELDTGKQYVAGGKERFKKLDYIQIGIKKKKPLPKDLQVKPVAHSRIIASARFRKPIQEPCVICVFINGDLLNPATRLLIPKRILGQWEQVLSSITEKVNLRTGAVRKLHTLDGKSVNDGTELENGGYYVAVGRDKFKKLPYGELIFSKSYPRRSNGSKAASLPPIPGSRKNKEHGDRQVRSTGTANEVYPLTSPQPPKRKEKKEQIVTGEESVFRAKPVKVKHVKNGIDSPNVVRENGGSWGAGELPMESPNILDNSHRVSASGYPQDSDVHFGAYILSPMIHIPDDRSQSISTKDGRNEQHRVGFRNANESFKFTNDTGPRRTVELDKAAEEEELKPHLHLGDFEVESSQQLEISLRKHLPVTPATKWASDVEAPVLPLNSAFQAKR
ncbi:doublecortin domain-containing protein 2-like [Mustelus asterias]